MSCLEATGTPEAPPLSNSPTIVEEELNAVEVLTLQENRTLTIAFPAISTSNDDLLLKQPEAEPRPKRLSLQAIKKPLLRAARGSSSNVFKKFTGKGKASSNGSNEGLQSAMASNDSAQAKKEQRRVSFSPSTEDIVAVRSNLEQERQQVGQEEASDKKESSKPLARKLKSIDSRRTLKPKRSASFNDSIGKGKGHSTPLRPPVRKRSLSISGSGIHLNIELSTGLSNDDKSSLAKPRVSRQQAMAARHAKVLERIMNAGSSIELEEIKAKRIKKLGAQKVQSKTHIQQYPVVSPRKIKALKEALMNHEMAIGIIEELREMQIDSSIAVNVNVRQNASNETPKTTEAEEALQEVIDHEEEKKVKKRPRPIRAICLNFTEVEIANRQSAALVPESSSKAAVQKDQDTETEAKEASAALAEASMMATALARVGNWFRSGGAPGQINAVAVESKTAVGDAIQFAYELADDVRQGDTAEALADTARLGTAGLSIAQPVAGAIAETVEGGLLPENKVPEIPNKAEEEKQKGVVKIKDRISDAFAGVSPISLITQPGTSLAAMGAKQGGVFDALADVSALAVQHEQGGVDAMQEIHPPTDRMAIFIYWWGFELTLPEPSMQYLTTAHSVSGAFLGFLQTMVTTGGVPEMLPFIRYISSFVDMEFNAIRSQDRNSRGVVIAATWLMPLALIPRPWDYGFDDNTGTNKKPVFKHPSQPTPPDDQSSSSQPTAPSYRFVPPPPPTQTLSPLVPGGLPILPVRISSTSTPTSATTSTIVFGTKVPFAKNSFKISSAKQLSRQERHFVQGQSAAIHSAQTESPVLRPRAMEPSNSNNGILSSLEEVPEGSVRVK